MTFDRWLEWWAEGLALRAAAGWLAGLGRHLEVPNRVEEHLWAASPGA